MQNSSGTLTLQLGALGASDRIIAEGDAQFGGVLNLQLRNGYSPKFVDRFRLFEFGASTAARVT